MISMDKQYQTRDGRKVRIYAVDGGGPFPIHGAVYVEGSWVNESWSSKGMYTTDQKDHEYDLIEVKPRIQRTVYLNIYKNFTFSHNSRESAEDSKSKDRLACIKVDVDCEEGQGL